jgi:pimeloyl-ACP methyl ester carboxylesterase
MTSVLALAAAVLLTAAVSGNQSFGPEQAATTFTVAGGVTVPVEPGEFTVPAVRRDPASPRIRLRYLRFRSTAPRPKAPIVFLAGGPGDAASRAFRGMPRAVLDALTGIADVIAFDQRGTGLSEPTAVLCPPAGGQPLDAPLDLDAYATSMKDRLTVCLPQLEAAGIRVAGFTTEESADDIDDLRKALGAPHVLLLAGSYGTHLALATARRHPPAVAGMALLGVEGPDDTVKRPSRVEATLAEIDKAKPGLVATVRQLLERLERQPWSKTLPNGQRVTVGVSDLKRRIADALDTVQEIDALPAALAAMSAGDYSDLVRWTIPFRSARPINVMHVAMDCASYASEPRLAAVRAEALTALVGDTMNAPLPAVCDAPGLPRLGDEFRAPVSSSIPALFISGTFDGRTPPANADAAAAHFTRAEHVVIAGASHGLFREEAAMAAVVRFLAQR